MPHQVGPWHRVPRDLNVLKLPSTGAGTLPQAQVSQPCRPAPSRTRGKLRHAHGLTFQDIPGSAMVTAPAVPGVPVPNNAGPIAVPLLRFAAATVPSDCDNSANAPATTTPPSKPAALWAVMAMTSFSNGMGDESAPSDEAASTLSSGHQAQDPEEISCEQGLLDGWLDKDGKVHRRHTADARILQRDLDDVFQIYDLLAPAEEPLRDLVEDGTYLPASSPASSAELFKTITAALALCTTVALRINKRGKKLHVEHEYGAEVAKEFDAVDPLGGKGSADYKELKKAIEKVKAKKPSSSSSREKPSSSSREPESFHRGSDDRREGSRREEKSPSVVAVAGEDGSVVRLTTARRMRPPTITGTVLVPVPVDASSAEAGNRPSPDRASK
eukprot:jgi/Tetstr1/463190/TSEL_008122.t1